MENRLAAESQKIQKLRKRLEQQIEGLEQRVAQRTLKGKITKPPPSRDIARKIS